MNIATSTVFGRLGRRKIQKIMAVTLEKISNVRFRQNRAVRLAVTEPVKVSKSPLFFKTVFMPDN